MAFSLRQQPNALIQLALGDSRRIGNGKRRCIDQFHSSRHLQHDDRLIVKPLLFALKAADVGVQGVGDLW
jgi:hypothetical protein